jgi:hypothetical protein
MFKLGRFYSGELERRGETYFQQFHQGVYSVVRGDERLLFAQWVHFLL